MSLKVIPSSLLEEETKAETPRSVTADPWFCDVKTKPEQLRPTAELVSSKSRR